MKKIVFIPTSTITGKEDLKALIKPVVNDTIGEDKKIKIVSLRHKNSNSNTWALAQEFSRLLKNSIPPGWRDTWEDKDFLEELRDLKYKSNDVVSFVDYNENEIISIGNNLGFKFQRAPTNLFYYAKF